MRWEVFGIVIEHGGKKELETLLKIWTSSINEDESYLALEFLGRTSSPELFRWVLDLSFTKIVKGHDLSRP